MALNNVSLMGRIATNPEIKTIGEDVHVTSFRIAIDRDRKNRDGERETDFITVTAWRHTCDFISQYFSVGDLIVIKGRIQTRQYTDKDGNNRTAFEVLAEDVYFGGAKKDDGAATTQTASQGAYVSADSDLPF